MIKKYFIPTILICAFTSTIGVTDANLLIGHEHGANGDYLTSWFTAMGRQVLKEIRKAEENKKALLIPELNSNEFEMALETQLVLVTPMNRDMLRNSFGEVKDIRLVRDQRTGRSLILLNAETLKDLYTRKVIDTRLVLHAYLLAAGKDDTNYRISGTVNLELKWDEITPVSYDTKNKPETDAYVLAYTYEYTFTSLSCKDLVNENNKLLAAPWQSFFDHGVTILREFQCGPWNLVLIKYTVPPGFKESGQIQIRLIQAEKLIRR